MFNRAKKLQARFYALPSGRKPVRDWILELRKGDRVIVGKDIQKVEFGWPDWDAVMQAFRSWSL